MGIGAGGVLGMMMGKREMRQMGMGERDGGCRCERERGYIV